MFFHIDIPYIEEFIHPPGALQNTLEHATRHTALITVRHNRLTTDSL